VDLINITRKGKARLQRYNTIRLATAENVAKYSACL